MGTSRHCVPWNFSSQTQDICILCKYCNCYRSVKKLLTVFPQEFLQDLEGFQVLSCEEEDQTQPDNEKQIKNHTCNFSFSKHYYQRGILNQIYILILTTVIKIEFLLL